LHTLKGHTNWVSAVAVTPDGRQIVSGSWDKTIKVWDAVSGRLLRTLEGHRSWLTHVSVTPDGLSLISRDISARSTHRWDLANGVRRAASADEIKNRLTPWLTTIENSIHLVAPDGSIRARLSTFRDGHWTAVGGDGLTYTGSDGCELHTRSVAPKSFRREKLDIDWP
jgi:WD40 repeat protein